MTASVAELIAIGFEKRTAYIIRKYIAAGGTIWDKASLAKIYGVDSVQLSSALAMIIFPEKPAQPIFEKSICTNRFNS